jgi:hypothetical protein
MELKIIKVISFKMSLNRFKTDLKNVESASSKEIQV